MDWNKQLTDQLEWHWRMQLRPRLEGLTDDEYFWRPVPDAWTVHEDGSVDFEYPEPVPAPITTIAWRLAHVIVGVFGARVASHFGGPPCDYMTWKYALSADEALKQLDDADEALKQLDDAYEAWMAGARKADLSLAVGPAEGPFAAEPMATLVLHINREVIHHGAEIALLRDLYLRES